MAGENSLPTQYYHDDQQIVTELISVPSGNGVPLLYADRNLIIDSVVVTPMIKSTATTKTATIQKTTAGTNDGITISPAAADATLSSIMGAGTINLNTFATTVVATDTATTYLDNTKNTLDAGNWLFFVPSETATSSLIAVQIRFRSRPK